MYASSLLCLINIFAAKVLIVMAHYITTIGKAPKPPHLASTQVNNLSVLWKYRFFCVIKKILTNRNYHWGTPISMFCCVKICYYLYPYVRWSALNQEQCSSRAR